MSSEEVRRVSREDIQLVQNLIEQCLQLHMSKKEVMNTLLVKAKIEPGFTELVWQKLEEENPEFFKAYHLRLLVKDQIVQFNRLLERQVELMQQVSAGATTAHMSNGSHIPLMGQNSACYGQEYTGPALQAGDMHQPLGSSLYTNGGSSSVNPCMQGTVDNTRRINTSSNMLMAQNSNMGLVQGMNGQMMKSGTGYINGSQCMFGPNGDVLDARHTAGDMSVSSYSSVESHSQPINNTLLGADSTYESLGPISRNFSLSDLTADFSLGSDILESYSGSPFLGAGSDNFLNPQYRVEQQDNRRLDTISEGLSYDNFGND